MEVRRNNVMDEVVNHERQHNGAGTLILVKKGIGSQ